MICRGLFKLPHSSLGFCYLWSDPNLKLTFPYRSGVNGRSEKMNDDEQLSEMNGELPEKKSVRSKFGPSSLDEEHDCITWLKIELDSATRFGEREKLKLCPRFTQRAFCSYRPCKLVSKKFFTDFSIFLPQILSNFIGTQYRRFGRFDQRETKEKQREMSS